ncbi:MAG TPA: class I SAM-dependent methyltransferase [Anaeromyxobacteraceae bacterium]|nr:class I SAM-dependent methyltransferase [Anaeromyxobacteraceae bacterium]
MILDPTDQFIRHITLACPVTDARVLEVGCGAGRVTRDLAARAREVVAIDPDADALARARAAVGAANVRFLQARADELDLPGGGFDVAVFSLSLHHVPSASMDASLSNVARHVRPGGRMVVVEPGDDGTLIEAETRFDVGDGDERVAKAAAREALGRLPGWRVVGSSSFTTLFHFQDVADFEAHLPARSPPAARADALRRFLESHREGDRIVLWASRQLSVLSGGLIGNGTLR